MCFSYNFPKNNIKSICFGLDIIFCSNHWIQKVTRSRRRDRRDALVSPRYWELQNPRGAADDLVGSRAPGLPRLGVVKSSGENHGEKPWLWKTMGKTGKRWWKMFFWIENGKTHVILLGKCWENPKNPCLFWIETGKLSSMDGDLPVRAHRNLKHVQMPQAFLQKWENNPTLRSRA